MSNNEHAHLLATTSHCHSHDRNDNFDLNLLPTPLDIYLSSTWTCLACNTINHFQQESALRPLGLMQCQICGKPASFGTKVDVDSLVPIEGKHFMISLPVGQKGPPKTIFLWVCCCCGRSHIGRAHKVHRLGKGGEKDKPKEELAIRLLHAAKKKIIDSSEKSKVDDVAAKDDGMDERRAYRVAFHKECKCGRSPCDSCLKFKVGAEGEWVAQEISLVMQPRCMDVLDRAAFNFRNAM